MAKITGELMQLETEKYVLQACFLVLVKKVLFTSDKK